MKQKALVSGGAGFIGYHLAKALMAQGYQVDLADNFSRGVVDDDLKQLLEKDDCQLRDLNLLDAQSYCGLDKSYELIFHLAAIVGVQNVIEAPYQVLERNIQMLTAMLAFAKTLPSLKRFVFASTSEVYAGTLQSFGVRFPTPEDTPLAIPDPANARASYMLSKILGEALCAHSGLEHTSVRFHNVYGPRMGLSHVIPELLQRAYLLTYGAKLEVFSHNHTRAFCYIDDAAAQLVALAGCPQCANQVFNLGNPLEEIRIALLAEKILKVLGKTNALILREAAPGSPVRRVPDISRLKAALGDVSFTSLDEGLRLTYRWYRDCVFEGSGVSAK